MTEQEQEQVTIDDLLIGAVEVKEVADEDIGRLIIEARDKHLGSLIRALQVRQRRLELQRAGLI